MRTLFKCTYAHNVYIRAYTYINMYSVDLHWNIHTYKHTSRAGQASGGSFKRKKSNKPIECAQGDQPARCPNGGFCVQQSSAVPSGGGVFVWCDVVTSGEMWCLPGNVLQSYYKVLEVLPTTRFYKVVLHTTKNYSVLQSTTKYNSATHETSSTLGGANCRTQNALELWHSCFFSRNTWIAQSNLWDAKHTGTTTFMFDSRNTWSVQYITQSKSWDAKRTGTATFQCCPEPPMHETSNTLRGATGVTLQHSQM